MSLLAASAAKAESFITIDPRQSNETHVTSINASGAIGGYFLNGFRYRAFIRAPRGRYSFYDVERDTRGYSLSDGGYAAGTTENGVVHGFVRDPLGSVAEFDAPKASYTAALSVNDSGEVAGFYKDHSGKREYGFVREPDGTIFPIKPARAKTTHATGINASGVVAGYYYFRGARGHGFIRVPDGTLTIFDCPHTKITEALAINDSGVVTGRCQDKNIVWHGFMRDVSGNITIFDPPDSTHTYPDSIAPDGSVAGWYNGGGFVRDAAGLIDTFLILGSQTNSTGINGSGRVVGTYYDTRMHGFLRLP